MGQTKTKNWTVNFPFFSPLFIEVVYLGGQTFKACFVILKKILGVFLIPEIVQKTMKLKILNKQNVRIEADKTGGGGGGQWRGASKFTKGVHCPHWTSLSGAPRFRLKIQKFWGYHCSKYLIHLQCYTGPVGGSNGGLFFGVIRKQKAIFHSKIQCCFCVPLPMRLCMNFELLIFL